MFPTQGPLCGPRAVVPTLRPRSAERTLPLRLRLPDHHVATVRTRNAAPDQQQIVFLVHPHQFLVPGGPADIAHVAGHPLTLLDALADAARRVRADAARRAVLALRAVGGRLAAEAVALHDAGRSRPFGRADDVHVPRAGGLKHLD